MATKEQAAQGPAFPLQEEGNSGPLNIGFKAGADPRLIPLGATQVMDQVRFEGGSLRKEFGWGRIGQVAATQILAIGEHTVNIAGLDPVSELVYQTHTYRIFRTLAGSLALETYDAVTNLWGNQVLATKKGFIGAWIVTNSDAVAPPAGDAFFNSDEVTLNINSVDSNEIDHAADFALLIVTQATLQIDEVIWTIDAVAGVAPDLVLTLSPGAQRPAAYENPTRILISNEPADSSENLPLFIEPIETVDTQSIQNVLAIATGLDPIMLWTVVPLSSDEVDLFTQNILEQVDDQADAVITVDSESIIVYVVDFDLDVSAFGGTITDLAVVMAVDVDGLEVVAKVYNFNIATLPEDLDNQTIAFSDQLSIGQTVSLRVKSLIATGTPLSETFVRENVNPSPLIADWFGAPNPSLPALSPPPAAANGYYRYEFTPVRIPRAGANPVWELELGYVDASNPGAPGVVIETLSFDVDSPGPQDLTLQMGIAPVFDTFVRFTITLLSDAPGADPLATSRLQMGAPVQVTWSEGSFVWEVLANELRYSVVSGLESQILEINPVNFPEVEAGFGPQAPVTAPIVRYLGSFGDRLFGLWEAQDRQILNASADGNVLMWELSQTGFPSATIPDDSTNLVLLDTRVDPVDDLMWILPVSSQVAIIARKRSLMRVFETGNIALSVGATHWKDGIGTEYPYAATICEGGIMFLGANKIVYYMTADQVIPVGADIYEELIKHLYPNTLIQRESLDCMYDPAFREYILGIPQDGSDDITHWYIFDLGRFLDKKEIVWRRRTLASTRLATVQQFLRPGVSGQMTTQDGVPLPFTPDETELPRERTLLFSDKEAFVNEIKEETILFNGLGFEGHWQSPTLSRGALGEEATLRTLGFQYSAEASGFFEVAVSGDGGQSYNEVKQIDVVNTNKQVRRVRMAFNTTGYDLRFQVRFPTGTAMDPETDIIKLFSYYPSIVTRGRTVL